MESSPDSNRVDFATVSITVLDVNDHTPTFPMQFYQVNISELTAVNTSVISLIATDRDEVANVPFLNIESYSILLLGRTWFFRVFFDI